MNALPLLDAYPLTGPFEIIPITLGNINKTFHIKAHEGDFCFQRLNPIFKSDIHLDIFKLTQHMAQKSLQTPLLIATHQDALDVQDKEGFHWRLMTWLKGQTFERLTEPKALYDLGHLVGTFHQALLDFSHTYAFERPHAHDTALHIRTLEQAAQNHKNHPYYEQVAPLAERVFNAFHKLDSLDNLPKHHTHGDLKISNVLFDEHLPFALVDLDTIGFLPYATELGDAFRSWCNPFTEEGEDATFVCNFFEPALEGYGMLMKSVWTSEEKESLYVGIKTLPLELSARFLADTLQETYFQADLKRFASKSAHHFIRGKNQFILYQSILKQENEIHKIIQKVFSK